MNRNVESHFSSVPRMNHPRSTFDRSHSLATAFNFGTVIPILCEEILPGDSVQLSTSKILRMQTLLTPAFANMYVDTYYFFVPNRILWDHFPEFMGENTQSSWYPTVEYNIPKVQCPSGGFAPNTIADYLGYPVNMDWSSAPSDSWPSALPLRAYATCCNEFFRDQNLSSPVLLNTSDSNLLGRNDGNDLQILQGGQPYHACKFKDLFTMCVRFPQKGPSVRIPFTGQMPVTTGPMHAKFAWPENPGGNATPLAVIPSHRAVEHQHYHEVFAIGKSTSTEPNVQLTPDGGDWTEYQFPQRYLAHDVSSFPIPGNLWGVADKGAATAGIDIAALRLGVLTQQYYERLAMAGSRYEEQLNAFFGVSNPDSRVNHPEYLGGSRVSINVNEVTNSAQSEQDFLGDVGAKSVTADSHFDVNKSFTEHGILLGVVVCRFDHVHTSKGMPRWFMRTSKFDFYNPMFADIGYQPVYEYELFADAANMESKQVFGYNEAWVHYRTSSNRVSGALRPQNNTALAHWTLADNFNSAPTLTDGFQKETMSPIDRITSVNHTVAPQVFGDFYFHLMHTRPMPMFSVPGAVGSF